MIRAREKGLHSVIFTMHSKLFSLCEDPVFVSLKLTVAEEN